MRVVIQRVETAKVVVEDLNIAEIGNGVMVLLGIESSDTKADADWLANKIAKLRIFDDANGVMNLSLLDCDGDALLVSQFTLHAKTKKGNRPAYIHAAPPDIAIPLYEYFVEQMKKVLGKDVPTGKFGAEMKVTLVNDGPVTIIIDTKNKE